MSRKKKHQERFNHERWLISYADFITLLFGFFVVMYSLSSINEGKYKVLTQSLEAAFTGPPKNINPLSVGKNASTVGETKPPHEAALENIRQELNKQLQGLIEDNLISVQENADWVEIQINSGLLFEPASATLLEGAGNIIKGVAISLKESKYFIRIEGFTDNVPIQNDYYRSNWDLSAARSAAVVRLLENNGLSAYRLSAVGYGEQFPIADNRTREGRNKNRRVSIIVEKNDSRTTELLKKQWYTIE
ncbi:MAG: flagellar motor protein MotB [Gammaproteobacteria bacterium]